MPFERRFLHYSPGPADFVGDISHQVVQGAWFELLRQGGCGAGEIVLLKNNGPVNTGDWIAFEYESGVRWYLGQVSRREALGRGAERLLLQGMGGQLEDVFPGGFGTAVADGTPPHRYAQTDLFPFDPDRSDETVDFTQTPSDVVRLLMLQYVVGQTDISYDPSRVEDSTNAATVQSLKVRGEDSVAELLHDLALRAGGFSWGVDAGGTFFFSAPKTTVLHTYQEGADLVLVEESRRRDLVFNRLQISGGVIYGSPCCSDSLSRGFFRWQAVYLQPQSRTKYGDRAFAVSLPWVRTPEDSRAFAREFFRKYAEPPVMFRLETLPQAVLWKPWEGQLQVRDAAGNELFTGPLERIRVQFDHAASFHLQLGVPEPQQTWPQTAILPRGPVGTPAGDVLTLSSSG